MAELTFAIGSYTTQNLKCDKISLKNIDLNERVQNIREKLSLQWKKDSKYFNDYNLIHHGLILNDEEPLQEAGIGTGALIYCFPKYDASPPAPVPLSLIEVQQLLVSLRAAVSCSNFGHFIQKLRTPDQIARLVSECPALRRDPAALAYIQDADLVYALQNGDHLSKLVDERPAVGRILQIVCNLITSEVTSPRRSHHVSYSLDALSDEEMDIDPADGDSESRSSTRRGVLSTFQPITPAQLAAALANATGSSGWGGPSSSAPRSGLTTPSAASTPFNTPAPTLGSGAAGGASPGGSLITTEMFSQALQNALAASASRSSNSLTVPTPTIGSSSLNQPLENVEESLQLMREMGIPDEELSLQALQATNGDVQAAVNLIFAQWMADD